MPIEALRVPTVLVVDDDGFMRAMLRQVFHEASINVETFDSAQHLLDEADLSAPAVLLLDVKMPGMSGLQLQECLRERGVVLPIVFMTASSDVPMAVLAMRNGAVDFLEKPFEKGMLVERVRMSLASASEPVSAYARRAHPEYAARLRLLTAREREVYDFMITGKTNKMIARDLGGSFRTVETHRSRVMQKMEATSLADLVRMTFEMNVDAAAD
jgi:two-component system, LuxR family, response regulator FixJ